MNNSSAQLKTIRPVDLDSDEIVAIHDIKNHWPGPHTPSRAAIFGYMKTGLFIRGSKERVKLPFVNLSGYRCTSVECIKLFLRAVNGLDAVPTVSKTQRRKMAEAHNELCAASGY